MKNILIYGFGRMGLTHYSILNGLDNSLKFTIVESNKKLSSILKRNLNATFIKDDSLIDKPFDITLITAPPFVHQELVKKALKRGDKKIFIEKPFGGQKNNINQIRERNVSIGYVLRYNPLIQWLKGNMNISEVSSVKGEYLSNTIENKPQGWRNNSDFSGVLNEMGSHVIDLINYLINLKEVEIINAIKKSVVSDADDIVSAEFKSMNRTIMLNLNWVDKNIRKPVFKLEFNLINGDKYIMDQQKISIYKNEQFIRTITTTDLAVSVPFYLRGVDFTMQMQDLLSDSKISCSIDDAYRVNNIMNKILNYENNTRG